MKKRLVRPSLVHLWNVEFPEVVGHNLAIVGKHNPAALHVEKFFGEVSAFAPQLDQMTQQERSSPFSAALCDKDDERCDLLRGIYNISRVAAKMPLEAESRAGLRMVMLFVKHGTNIPAAGYTAKTHRIGDLCYDVDEDVELQEALATLGLTAAYAALKQANIDFDSLVYQRTNERVDRVRVDVRPLRLAAGKALTELWDGIEHAAAIFADVDYEPLITELNAYNSGIRTLLKTRAARNKN